MDKAVKHIAFVMDGNGRWATSRGLPRSEGHKAGSQTIRALVKTAVKLGIREITLFGLSCDNVIKRPQQEVNYLLRLIHSSLEQYLAELVEQGVRLLFIGDIEGLGSQIAEKIHHAMEVSKGNKRVVLTVAVNFSGSWHIVNTTKQLLQKMQKLGKMPSDEEIQHSFSELLPSSPDILIRTGGDKRISDFVMYHLGYTELFFLDTKWPDFEEKDLLEVIQAYQETDRRFGGVV